MLEGKRLQDKVKDKEGRQRRSNMHIIRNNLVENQNNGKEQILKTIIQQNVFEVKNKAKLHIKIAHYVPVKYGLELCHFKYTQSSKSY